MITGVLAALLTPLDENGKVKTELAPKLIDFYVDQGANGLYMLGWTGEGAYLDKDARKEWAEAVLAAAKDKIKVFVHCGYNENLDDSVELAAHAAAHGAYAVSSVGISKQATLQENVEYFKRISEAAPNVPFYIYWVDNGKTITGGKSILPAELLEAMKDVPTFKGIKFTDTNFYILERFKKHNPELNILTGADELAFCSRLMGADGNIGALQAITCYHYQQMDQYILNGEYKKARELQYRANNVAEAYARESIGNLPGIKYIMREYYGIDVGICSPNGPFAGHSVSEEDGQYLMNVFKTNILVK